MKNLTRQEAECICADFFKNVYSDKEIAEILLALSKKGETAEEIVGFSDSLRKHSELFPFQEPVFDVCGTGGSAVERFNVSTAVAFVLASLNIKVAKHGNRGSHRSNGSFDFLEELGINIDVDGNVLSDCLEKTGLAFVFAPKFHHVMKNVVEARRLAGCRTIFNLAGPISNPANVEKQIIGVSDYRLVNTMLKAGQILGRKKFLVVSGYPSIDEFSVSGVSVIALSNLKREIVPEQIGIKRCDYSKIPCGNAKINAKNFLALINNLASKSLEDMVCANAGLALALLRSDAITVADIKNGICDAREAISSGLVKKKFEEYKKTIKRCTIKR